MHVPTTTLPVFTPQIMPDEEPNNCCSVKNVLRPIFKFSGTVGAIGTLAVSAVTLGLYVEGVSALGAVIATVAVSAVMVPYSLGKESYEYWDEITREKKIKIKEKERDELEGQRHEEVRHLFAKNMDAINEYANQKNAQNYHLALETIRQCPENNPYAVTARDTCFSTLAKNNDDLKEISLQIQKLADKIDAMKQDPEMGAKPNMLGQTGEGANRMSLSTADSALDIDLGTFQLLWNRMEAAAGYQLNALTIGGNLYDRNATRIILNPIRDPLIVVVNPGDDNVI